MLYILSKPDDPLVSLFRDDPVRPEISADFRCHLPNNLVFVLKSDSNFGSVDAVLCCAFKNRVPASYSELLDLHDDLGKNAIFYTVWSYGRGGGRRIIPLAQAWIREHRTWVRSFYTFSPFGEQVRNFHFSLGADLYRENSDSVNYHYT